MSRGLPLKSYDHQLTNKSSSWWSQKYRAWEINCLILLSSLPLILCSCSAMAWSNHTQRQGCWLLWIELQQTPPAHPARYIQILTPGTCECDLIWKDGLWGYNQDEVIVEFLLWCRGLRIWHCLHISMVAWVALSLIQSLAQELPYAANVGKKKVIVD